MARKVRLIADDTPILPMVVAKSVVDEVDRCYPLPPGRAKDELPGKLAHHANLVYENNAAFRRKIRARGDKGRDALYAFMRHWLAAELHDTQPAIYRRLPERFRVGEPLVCITEPRRR